MRRLALALVLGCLPAWAVIEGVVVNQTSGKPEPRVPITLISFAQGMDPIEEVVTDDQGRFRFEKDPPGMRLLRTEHQQVSYTRMLQPTESPPYEVEIFEAQSTPAIEPTGRILIFEPGESQLVINESYLFENGGRTTFRDPERGSLRFYLPPEAKGIVQVEATGPARMPLPSSADPTGEENIYKVDFPIKPGENRISLTYLVPYAGGETTFTGKAVYPRSQTRLAIPEGVEVESDSLESLDQEPSTRAMIYQVRAGGDFSLRLRGQGRIHRNEPVEAAGASTEIRIEKAPISAETGWILALTAAILALGFFNLWKNRADIPEKPKRGEKRSRKAA